MNELTQWLPDISSLSFASVIVIIACIAILWYFRKALWNILVIFLCLFGVYAMWLHIEHPKKLDKLMDTTEWTQQLPEKVKRVWEAIKE